MVRLVALLGMSGCFVGEAELNRALDRDGDGVLPLQAGGDDCDESRADVRPGAAELCGDGIDNDCDGIIDDDGVGAFVWYLDEDDDGYGTAQTATACVEPAGYAPVQGDCDDGNQAYNPGVLDLCDGLDQDCDGIVDDDAVQLRRYQDLDGDGWGDDAVSEDGCAGQAGWVDRGGDCDDTLASVNPSVASDPCDGVDQDCDGATDEDAVFELIWPDLDLDGWGSEDPPVLSCDPPAASAVRTGDCDDLVAGVNPGVVDMCDGVDANCDGVLDDDASFTIWFADADGDGLGDALAFVETCDGPPAAHVPFAGDCDDSDASATIPVWYPDDDGDGFGRAEPVPRCEVPAGHTDRPGDCDDQASDVNPDQDEVCNNRRDDDCDPVTDCRWSGELTEADAQVYILPPGTTLARFLGADSATGLPELGVWTANQAGISTAPLTNPVVLDTFLPSGSGFWHSGAVDVDGDEVPEFVTRGSLSARVFDGASLEVRLTVQLSGIGSSALASEPGIGIGVWLGRPVSSYAAFFVVDPTNPTLGSEDWQLRINGLGGETLGSSIAVTPTPSGNWTWVSSVLPGGAGRIYGFADLQTTNLTSTADVALDGPNVGTLRVAAADLNDDGFTDLVFRGVDRGNGLGEGFVSINFGPLDANLPTMEGARRLYGQPGRMDHIEPVGDLDGDGDVDFAAVLDGAGQGNALIPIWFGGQEEQGIADAGASFLNTDMSASVRGFAGIADVDGDGFDDLGLVLIDETTQAARLVVLPGRGL